MKLFFPAALAAAAVWPLVFAQAPAPPIQISADALKAGVSFLASDALEGRATPSRGLEIAGEFIASQFRRAGLEPAGDDGYFQNASYVSVAPNLEGFQLTIKTGDHTYTPSKEALALQEAAAADVKDAGTVNPSFAEAAGVTPEQVHGKVLVIDVSDRASAARGMRQLPAMAAMLRPALIVLLDAGPPRADPAPRLREAAAAAPLVPVIRLWDTDARKALAGTGAPLVSAHIAPPTITPVRLRNVVGLLRGSDATLKESYIVVSGHYDHLGMSEAAEGDRIYNGANDDASGTSSVIEIAGALAALEQRPRRSIVFVTFFGEEIGGYGSRYYCTHPVFPVAKTIANINLEQLGRTDDDEGPRVRAFNLTGFDYSGIAPAFTQAGKETGVRVEKHATNSDAFFRRSDNASFAQVGIPSTTVSVSYTFPDYHQPGDEWPKLDYENMAQIDRTVALAILHLANSPDAPQWNRDNPRTAGYIRARENSRPQ